MRCAPATLAALLAGCSWFRAPADSGGDSPGDSEGPADTDEHTGDHTDGSTTIRLFTYDAEDDCWEWRFYDRPADATEAWWSNYHDTAGCQNEGQSNCGLVDGETTCVLVECLGPFNDPWLDPCDGTWCEDAWRVYGETYPRPVCLGSEPR